jgi:hypothetical protein
MPSISSESAPQSLRGFMSDIEVDVDDAIYGFLHSEASHQYNTYSFTPYVVAFVLNILEHKEFNSSVLAEILGSIRAFSWSAEAKESALVPGLQEFECI